ncbi:MAG: hypothetical protein K2N23_02045 [Clostridia bacterium]|nr:hypothetical protein [Clostridia bacterium]
MNTEFKRMLSLDRDDMSDFERELFLSDVKKVTDEYFESDGNPSLEVTRVDDGFLICLLMSARRIKNVKKPQ